LTAAVRDGIEIERPGDGTGLLQGMYDVLLQLVWAGTFERKTHPHAAAEREQFL
jgi:hypothetical protein